MQNISTIFITMVSEDCKTPDYVLLSENSKCVFSIIYLFEGPHFALVSVVLPFISTKVLKLTIIAWSGRLLHNSQGYAADSFGNCPVNLKFMWAI